MSAPSPTPTPPSSSSLSLSSTGPSTSWPGLRLPPEDRDLSSFSGWGRQHLEAATDALVAAAVRYASPSGSLLNPPGRDCPRSGRWSDGLEGYARVGLLVGARVGGAGGADPHGMLERWASGLTAGTDPTSPERWPTPGEVGQAKVEAAAVALLLEQTRPWLWDQLDAGVQERVVAWFEHVVGAWYPRNNWVWFRLVVAAFLASVGGRWSPDDAAEDLALHETFERPGGWNADGAGRDFDHYGGWALHLYPLLWARQPGAAQVAAAAGHDLAALRARWAGRLHAWLPSAALLVGSDGDGGAVPLLQGRSLTYRFAAAAPFWVGALEGCSPLDPGLTRRVGLGMARHFLLGGSLRTDGTLSLGWQHEFLPLAQAYSGPSSPYWAAKGVIGLLLPADHPVWTAVEQPLPVEAGDTAAVMPTPGWLVSGTRADGVVRVLNHGTDHAVEGSLAPDDPLYARLGLSTATSPDLGAAAAGDPVDSAVAVLDAAGRASHRTGFRWLEVTAEASGPSASSDSSGADGTLVAFSQGRVHWHDDASADAHVGPAADGTPGPVLTTASLVRGPLEVRLARLESAADDEHPPQHRLRVGGWAVGEDQLLTSTVVGLRGLPERGSTTREGASPFSVRSSTPWVAGTVREGEVVAALVVLTGDHDVDPAAAASRTRVSVTAPPGTEGVVDVTWPDGTPSHVVLPTSHLKQPDPGGHS